MRKKFLLFQFLVLFTNVVLFAQQRRITGTIKDFSGPLPGATVSEKGQSSNVTAADVNGLFKITLHGTSFTLLISNIGYQPEQVNVKNQNQVEVVLQNAVGNLDEVVVTGYSRKKQITNTGAVSTIKAEEIKLIPTSNVQNALAGKVPGFFTQQRSGQPGHDGADYFIRGVSSLNSAGNRPLIIVDDIEYTYEQLAQINVNEIESISILKDASTTAVFGIKGANGVLVVTTHRGSLGKPSFNFRVEGGGQMPVRTPKFLDSYHTALLVNEAYKNDGLQPSFTQNDLDLFQNGTDPYGHPNVNWYDQIMRPTSMQSNTNLDISGGTQAVKYFISGGAFTQSGNIKDFSTNTDGVNSNYFYKRYNVRSNLDIQATKNLSVRLDLTTRFGDINQPVSINALGSIYSFESIHPYSAPVRNPNGTFSYAYDTKNQAPTLNAMLETMGYSRNRQTDFNTVLGFKEKLDDITKGLALTGQLAFASSEQNTLNLRRGGYPPTYHFNPGNNTYTLNTGPNGGGYAYSSYYTTGNTDYVSQRVNLQFFLNYERTFESHHVKSFFMWNQQTNRSDNSASVPSKFRGYSLQLAYDYKQKYLIDFNGAYNGSDRFTGVKRNGFFPALSVGWNLAQEDFFKNKLPVFSQFKLRGSFGILGSDITYGDQYLYNQVYNQGGGYSFGESNQGVPTIYEGNLGNNNVTWEKVRKVDVGLDITMFTNKLNITVDYFHDYRYDQLVTRRDVPVILGIGLPSTNVGITVNGGGEIAVTYLNKIGHFRYSAGANLSYAKNKIIYMAEASQRFPWLSHTGQSINQPFGYTFLGYYSPADIADSKVAKPNSAIPIQAGDLKYKDLNSDGIIDLYDQGPIGKPNLPAITFGVPIRIGYKNFDFSVLFQGATAYSLGLVGNAIEPFQSQFQPIHELRWTPENMNNAQFPRLTSNPTTINSASSNMSDFWLLDTHYIRLKTLEMSYQFPANWLPMKINNGRIYMSAYNLVTWTNIGKRYQQDPEVSSLSAGDAYQNQRVINIGVQIGF